MAHQKLLVFVHIEKTAGTSLKFILRNNYGAQHCDTGKTKTKVFDQAELDYAKSVFGTIQCISGHNIVEPTKHLSQENLLLLTYLRNPITRSASYYQDHVQRAKQVMPFEQFMENPSFHNTQTKRIAGEENVEKAIELLEQKYAFVGLTERFDESLKLFSLICPDQLNLKYKKKLVSVDNTVKNGLIENPETLSILQAANQYDQQLYNYVSTELFPKRIAEHQEELQAIELPSTYYSHHRLWNYQRSVGFNKYVYRQRIKRR